MWKKRDGPPFYINLVANAAVVNPLRFLSNEATLLKAENYIKQIAKSHSAVNHKRQRCVVYLDEV